MSDIQPLKIQNKQFYDETEKVIFKDYKCNCQKGWIKDDRFIVYKADSSGIVELLDDNVDSSRNLGALLELSKQYLTDKIIISGGHTVVNLNDRFSVSPEVEKSAKFCIDYIVQSINKLKIQPDFLMEINDFYMEKSNGHEIDGANEFRKMAISPYIMPEKISEYIIASNNANNLDIKSFYVSEKNMADRFKRHIKNKINSMELFTQIDNNVLMNINELSFEVIKDNKPTCAAGNAAIFRAIRYNISSNKCFDNYTSHIGVFPLCSKANVLNGYLAASAFYEKFDLPSLLVFFGKSCYQ